MGCFRPSSLPFTGCGILKTHTRMGFPGGSIGKEPTYETQVPSLSREDPLEEGTATHSSILAWRIPCIEEPGGLQSIGLQRVQYD